MLRIDVENLDAGLHVLRLEGSLDGLTFMDLHGAGHELAEDGAKKVVLDMNLVDYSSSAGLRAILMCAKALKEQEGEIVLFGMNSAVKEVFKLSGFESLFKTFASEEKALAG